MKKLLKERFQELAGIKPLGEQVSNDPCSANSMWCHQNLTNATPNPSWITKINILKIYFTFNIFYINFFISI